MPNTATAVSDDLDSFMAQRHAHGASQSSDETSGDDDIDAFMQGRRAAGHTSSDNSLKMPPLFAPAIPRTPPSVAATKVGQPPVRLGLPDSGFDTTKIPRNVFTGGAQGPGMATEEEKARWRASLSDEDRQKLEEYEQRQATEGTPYHGD